MAELLSDADVGFGAGGDGPKLLSDADVGFKSTAPDPGLTRNAVAGAGGATDSLIGAPVDIAAAALRHPSFPAPTDAFRQNHPTAAAFIDKFDAALEHPIGGSEWIENIFGHPQDVAAPSTADKLVRSAAGGAVSAAVPALGAEAMLSRVAAEGESFGRAALEMIRGSGTTSNAVIGGASGAAGEVAAEAAHDKYKPLARLAGSVAGGIGAAGAAATASAAGSVGRQAWQSIAEPAEVRAARLILSKASDPDAFKAALSEGAPGTVKAGEEGEANLAGSTPTTFQATGDLGIGAYEHAVASTPSGFAGFAERRQEQNAARLSALEDLADPHASPAAVTDFVKSRLNDITVDHAAEVAQAADSLAGSLTKAGGENFDSPAGYGEALRAPLDALHKSAKAQTNELWRAIDPDMSVPVSTAPLKQTTADLIGDLPSIAKQPEGEEGAILSGINDMGKTASFGDIVALRSRLTDAIMAERRSANGSPTVLRRLAITLGSVDDTLAGKAADIAANPEARTAMVDRFQANLEADRDQYYAQQNAGTAPNGRGIGGGGPQGAGEDAGIGSQAVPVDDGTEVPASGGLRDAAGNQSLSPTGGIPEDVASRYAAARASTAAQKQTFERGPVGAVLKPGPTYGSFAAAPSNVPRNLFDKPEALTAFVKAAGDDPAAMDQMQDFASYSLRQAAVRNGQLDPAKYQKWVADHGYALRSFPDVASNFADVARAQGSLDTALAAQKNALVDYQTSAARHFLNDQDPVQAVGKAIGNPGEFAKLAASMRDNPAALAGLKRATVEYMLSKTLGTAEAGTSGLPQINAASLQKFIASNRLALSSIFSGEERNTMEAIAGDLQRANRSIVAAKLPGSPGTAQDLMAMQNGSMSMMQRLIWQAIGTAGGSVAGHPVLGFMAGAVGPALRAARMDSINKAVTEMMLNPRLASAALAKIPQGQAESAAKIFAQRVRSITANQVMTEAMRSRPSN